MDVGAGLAEVERLRALPGAAALVDEIVAYLKTAPPGAFSVANLPRDGRGLARLDEHSEEHMIRDPVLRAKWRALMDIAAKAAARRGASQDAPR